jgi:hypothetical protein
MNRAVIVLALAASAACSSQSASAPAQGTDGGTTTSPLPETCAHPNVPDLRVNEEDLYAFPPYAMDGCSLVYVATSGDLVERDLSSGGERVVAPSAERPRRPALAAGTLAWEADEGGTRVVRVRQDGAVSTARGPFARAGEPRAADGAVSFTGWTTADERGDSDVFLYDAKTGKVTAVGTGAGQQRFSDISTTHVAFSDFSEDPDGRFDDDETDLADIVVYERATGKLTRRALPGKQAFPVLASPEVLGYLSWNLVHPEPKLEAFNFVAGKIGADPGSDTLLAVVRNTSMVKIRPSAKNGVFDWVDRPDVFTRLWRASLEQPTPVQVAGLDGLDLFAPVSAGSVTILAARDRANPGEGARLRVVAR